MREDLRAELVDWNILSLLEAVVRSGNQIK